MPAWFWAAADWAFTLLHLAVVLGVALLWIPRCTRRAHLLLVGLTGASWLGLGALYGHIGYCFLTDWHWQVKRARGEGELPASFIQYMATNWLELPVAASTTDACTGLVFALAALAAIAQQIYPLTRDRGRET